MSAAAEADADGRCFPLIECQSLKVRVTIHQILAVDICEETFTAEFDAFFRWEDPRLKNFQTRVWLPRGSAVPGQRTCSPGSCLCASGKGVCSGLSFVEGVFQEQGGKKTGKIQVPGRPVSELEGYVHKEEPNFEDFGQLFGDTSSVVSFAKLVEEPTVLVHHQRLTDGRTGEVVLFRKLLAKFKENMELRRFPFDRQLLQFTITSSVPTCVLRLEIDKMRSACNPRELAEYRVDAEEQKDHTIAVKTVGSSAGKQYSQIRVVVHLERKPTKHLVNVVLLLYILVLASFSNFIVDLLSPGDRMSIIATFVLTSMAMKYVINDQLPGKSYQTWLDLYLLTAYIFLSLPAAELISLSLWLASQKGAEAAEVAKARAQNLDWLFCVALFITWNAFHFVLLAIGCCGFHLFWQDWDVVRGSQGDEQSLWQWLKSLAENPARSWSYSRPCAESDSEEESG